MEKTTFNTNDTDKKARHPSRPFLPNLATSRPRAQPAHTSLGCILNHTEKGRDLAPIPTRHARDRPHIPPPRPATVRLPQSTDRHIPEATARNIPVEDIPVEDTPEVPAQ